MARISLAAARRAVRRLFCSASTDDGGEKGDNSHPAPSTSPSANTTAHEKSSKRSAKNDSANDAAMEDYAADTDKENVPPARDAGVSGLPAALGGMSLGQQDEGAKEEPVVDEDPEVVRVREENLRFIGEALEMVCLFFLCVHGIPSRAAATLAGCCKRALLTAYRPASPSAPTRRPSAASSSATASSSPRA